MNASRRHLNTLEDHHIRHWTLQNMQKNQNCSLDARYTIVIDSHLLKARRDDMLVAKVMLYVRKKRVAAA